TLFREYQNDKTQGRLDFLINNTAITLPHLARLGFVGYRSYMVCAGLRLGVLQQVVKNTGKGKDNFIVQRKTAVAHHKEVSAAIDAATVLKTVIDSGPKLIRMEYA